jgi:hypothetical protein
MATLTWTGGGNNSVYNASDWSPNATPQPGDSLYFLNGTANMRGGDLAGDTLNMGFYNQVTPPQPASANPVLNVSHGARLNIAVSSTFGTPNSSTINVTGRNTLNISGDTSTHFGPTTLQINLHHAALDGSLHIFNEHVVVGGSGRLVNEDVSISIGTLTINADMTGTGRTSLAFAQVEIGGSVSSGQSFSFAGTHGTLTIDDPRHFHGSISGPADSSATDNEVLLQGVHADSYSLMNDMLMLYRSNKVVERLQFHETGVATFVGQGSSGVLIGMNLANPPAGFTALSPHSHSSVT